MAQALETIKNMGDSIGSSLFRKDLVALVRGIRANKDNESKFISAALQEIKEELQSTDKEIKAMAVQKLTYVRPLPPLGPPFLRFAIPRLLFISRSSCIVTISSVGPFDQRCSRRDSHRSSWPAFFLAPFLPNRHIPPCVHLFDLLLPCRLCAPWGWPGGDYWRC